MDGGRACLGLFLDLGKAFDLVDHAVLLDKLECCGVRGVPLRWFESYLLGRQSYVEVNKARSHITSLVRGIPQGSVLGPLLYLIYVCDLPSENAVMFADDTSVLITARNHGEMVRKANERMTLLGGYFASNDLYLNPEKTRFVHFNVSHFRDNNDCSFLVRSDGVSIKQTADAGFLGITIDGALRWCSHIDRLCKRLSSACYSIKRLHGTVDLCVLRMYYFASVHSLMKYGIVAWGVSSDFGRVFRLQKRAIRFMAGVTSRHSCRELFGQMSILTLPCVLIMELLMYVRSNLNSFKTLGQMSSYQTRNSSTLEVPMHRTSVYENSPHYLGVVFYNKLPIMFKTITVDKLFKYKVREFFISKAYYSYGEYLTDSL